MFLLYLLGQGQLYLLQISFTHWIACCNVLSDLYAMGVDNVSTILMVLGVCLKMNEREQEVTTSLMIEGFNDCAEEAGTKLTGGQSIMSPWPIIGGVGIAGVTNDEFLMPVYSRPGDQIILTKPLATQIAVNSYQWMQSQKPQWEKVKNITNPQEIEQAFQMAEESMATLNRYSGRLLQKYQAKACTDITGFGILGHAKYLAQAQQQPVKFKIHTLPLIRNMLKLEKQARDFKILEGTSAETSGGLFVVLPPDQVDGFLSELKQSSQFGWHIGEVVESVNNTAEIVDGVRIIEV